MTLDDSSLALLSGIVQAIVIGLLIFRKSFKKLPLFFSYLIWLLIVSGASVALANRFSSDQLQRIFVVAEVVDAAFMFCVLVELSMSVLSPIRAALPSWSVFAVGAVLALILAIIWPFAKPPGFSALNVPSQVQVHVDTATSVLRIIFFLALAGFSQLLSLSWRDRELQIGTGLGIFAFVSLSATLLKMNVGTADVEAITRYHTLDQLQVGGYIVAMFYWVVSFAQKVPERREFTPQMENFLLALAGTASSTRMAMKNSSKSKKKSVSDEKEED